MNLTTTSFIEKIKIKNQIFNFVSLQKISEYFKFDLLKLPFSFRILIENIVRCETDISILSREVGKITNRLAGE